MNQCESVLQKVQQKSFLLGPKIIIVKNLRVARAATFIIKWIVVVTKLEASLDQHFNVAVCAVCGFC